MPVEPERIAHAAVAGIRAASVEADVVSLRQDGAKGEMMRQCLTCFSLLDKAGA